VALLATAAARSAVAANKLWAAIDLLLAGPTAANPQKRSAAAE